MSKNVVSRRAFLGGTAAGMLGAALPMRGGEAIAGERVELRDEMRTPKAWERFLARQDLVWRRVPGSFYEGPFLGNGGLGAAVYHEPDRRRLRFVLGDNRVRDHQQAGVPSTLFGGSRLRIGHLALETAGEVTGVDLRLSLWDAELRGTVTTTAGSVELRAFVHATSDLLVVELTPGTGEQGVGWSFTPYKAESPRLASRPRPPELKDNPPAVVEQDEHGGSCVQDLTAGGGTATAWRVTERGRRRTLVATVVHTYPERTALDRATAAVERASRRPVERLAHEHRRWWHDFYPRSFVSVPDGRLESFYWIQLYKMACATRADRPVIGTCAQWLEPTPWPGTWWNLNVQLEYWLIYATGHEELDSLTRSLDEHRDNLALNVPEAYRQDSYAIDRTTQEDLLSGPLGVPGVGGGQFGVAEVGNLPWALHNVWLAYRHTMDDELLRSVVVPLLRRSVNYYLHFLADGADGRLHLPTTYSPEYASTPDCNYDLALLTWGCRTLLDATERLGIADPLRPRWREVLDRLVAPPQGPDGLWIGAARQLTSSHRHYSHLLWFHPLHLLDPADPGARDLLERSLAHWVGFEGALQGYTFTGAASMSALLRDGERALGFLGTLLDEFVQPNTMYRESGPVIETPLSGAQSLHDMLVQSWGGTIRVFPAVPWDDVVIHDLRVEGAFLVSAARRGGRTQFARVKSLAGEPCRVEPGLPGPYDVCGARWREVEDGVLELELREQDEAVVFTRGTRPDLRVAPVDPGAPGPYWGLT